jgi:hypothetical protein
VIPNTRSNFIARTGPVYILAVSKPGTRPSA